MEQSYAFDRAAVVYSVASFDAPDDQIDVVVYGVEYEPLVVRRFDGDALSTGSDSNSGLDGQSAPVANWLRDVVDALLTDSGSNYGPIARLSERDRATRWIVD